MEVQSCCYNHVLTVTVIKTEQIMHKQSNYIDLDLDLKFFYLDFFCIVTIDVIHVHMYSIPCWKN